MDDRTTLTFQQEFHRAGYDQEEAYFHRQNLRVIYALRRAQRVAEAEVEPTAAKLPRSERRPNLWHRFVALFFKPRPIGIGEFPV